MSLADPRAGDTKTPNANSAHNLATDHTRAAVIPSRPTYAEMAARAPPPPIRDFHQNRPPRQFDRPQRGRGTGPGIGHGYSGRHQKDTMHQGAEMVVEPNRTMTGINVATSNTFSKQNTGVVGELKRLLLL